MKSHSPQPSTLPSARDVSPSTDLVPLPAELYRKQQIGRPNWLRHPNPNHDTNENSQESLVNCDRASAAEQSFLKELNRFEELSVDSSQSLEGIWPNFIRMGRALATTAIVYQPSEYESIITDPKGKHDTFCAFGNGTIRVCDIDGNPFPIVDKEYLKFLSEGYPAKHQILSSWISVVKNLLSDSEEFCNLKIADLSRIAKEEFSEEEDYYKRHRLVNAINQGIIDQMSFMSKYKKGKVEFLQMPALADLCKKADLLYEHFINMVFGEDGLETFALTDDVLKQDNPGELLLMALNDSIPEGASEQTKRLYNRIRIEAKNKLLFAYELGKLQDYKERSKPAPDYFDLLHKVGAIDEGGLTKRYLVSYHPQPGVRDCTKAYFTDEFPDDLEDGYQVSELYMRSITVNEGGQERKIYVFLDSRTKEDFNIIFKKMLKNTRNIDNAMEDQNGICFMVEDRKDFTVVLRHFADCLRKAGYQVDEWDPEYNLNGREGDLREGQSSDWESVKFMQRVTSKARLDENGEVAEEAERSDFEIQLQDAKMYANAKNRIGVAHGQYSANRYFESELVPMIVCHEVHDYDELEWQMRRNMESIRSKNWGADDDKLWAADFIAKKIQKIRSANYENGLERQLAIRNAVDWANLMQRRYKLPSHLKSTSMEDLYESGRHILKAVGHLAMAGRKLFSSLFKSV